MSEVDLRANLRRMTCNHLSDMLPFHPAPRPIDSILVQLCDASRLMLSVWPGEQMDEGELNTLGTIAQSLSSSLDRKTRPRKESPTDGLVLLLADAIQVLAEQWKSITKVNEASQYAANDLQAEFARKCPSVPIETLSRDETPLDSNERLIKEEDDMLSNIITETYEYNRTAIEEGEEEMNYDIGDEPCSSMSNQQGALLRRSQPTSASIPFHMKTGRSVGAFECFFHEMFSEERYPDCSYKKRRSLAKVAFQSLLDKTEWVKRSALKRVQSSEGECTPRKQRPIDFFIMEVRDDVAIQNPGLPYEDRRKIMYRMWSQIGDRSKWEQQAKDYKHSVMRAT